MKEKYKFIHFKETGQVWTIHNNRTGNILGYVEFYEPWKQWVSHLEGSAIFSSECHSHIAAFMDQLKEAPDA